MPSFFDNLRLQNIFAPQQQNTPPPFSFDFSGQPKQPTMPDVSFGPQTDFTKLPTPAPTPNIEQETPFDVSARMRELYQPETMATDRFNQLLSEMPQWEKPGVWRSIAAALSAFGPGGHDIGMKVAQQPYMTKMADWKSKMDPAYQAANLERQSNMNERQLAHQTVSGELTSRRDDARAKSAEEANRIRADRAEVYRLKSLRPNFKFDFSGPTVLVSDPTTGNVTDTGLSTGSLSDSDKLALQQENALERIGATAAEQRTTEGVKQDNRVELAWSDPYEVNLPDGTKKYMQTNRATGDIREAKFPGQINKVGTGRTNTETPTQVKVRQYNAAREFASKNPQLAKFVKLGKNNDFTITPPGKGGMFGSVGPTPEEHQKIISSIYGGDVPIQQPTRTGATTETPTTQNVGPNASNAPKYTPEQIRAATPKGRVAVVDKNGNYATVPQDQLAEAVRQGYKEVR